MDNAFSDHINEDMHPLFHLLVLSTVVFILWEISTHLPADGLTIAPPASVYSAVYGNQSK